MNESLNCTLGRHSGHTTVHNSMFALWPGDWLNFSTFKPTTFGYGGQTAASEAGHIANTNVVHYAGGHTSRTQRVTT